MSRVRISTTVDGRTLQRCRRLADRNDSRLLDQALALLLEHLETEREIAALEAHPYHEDPDLNWQARPPASLPYDGEVPADVQETLRVRRESR